MLEYARWKYILVAVVLAVALLFALPNLFGDDFALQIARKDRSRHRCAAARDHRERAQGRRRHVSRSVELDDGNVIVRFADNETQLKRPRHRQGREDRPHARTTSTR